MERIFLTSRDDSFTRPISEALADTWRLDLHAGLADTSGRIGGKAGSLLISTAEGSRVGMKWGEGVVTCSLWYDARPEPLVLQAAIAQNGFGKLQLENHGFRLSLQLDGVLVDEEWPLGVCSLQGCTCRVEQADDVEIVLCSLDACDAAQSGDLAGASREVRVIGPVPSWQPDGIGVRVGDCMPYHDGKRFHFLYLADRHGHRSKWSLGAHQWAHASTADLREWTLHPLAIPVSAQWEGSICTGSVFVHEGVHYAFYAVRMSDGTAAPLTWAESRDGIHYVKSGRHFFLKAPYHGASARDPEVFMDREGLFHMLVTTSVCEPEPGETPLPDYPVGGCLAHLVSTDLSNWTQLPPFYSTGHPDQPECACRFRVKDWHYLVFSQQGTARYRKSRSPLGPWVKPDVEILDGYSYRVPKIAVFPDGSIVSAGFLAEKPDEYAGCAVFREWRQTADGNLLPRFAEWALPEASGESIQLEPVEVDGTIGYAKTDKSIGVQAFRLQGTIRPKVPSMQYGIRFGNAGLSSGWVLRFEPDEGKAGFHAAEAHWTRLMPNLTLETVRNLSESGTVDLLVRGTVVDLMLNGERTMVHRLAIPEGGYSDIGFFAMAGKAEFQDFRLIPVENPG